MGTVLSERDSLGRFVGGRSNPAFLGEPTVMRRREPADWYLDDLKRERLLDQAVRNVATDRHARPMPWQCATLINWAYWQAQTIRAEFARLAKGG